MNLTSKTGGTSAPADQKKHNVWCSLAERVDELNSRWPMTDRTRSNLLRSLQSVDDAERRKFLEKHSAALEGIETLRPVKYADLAYWGLRNVLLAQWLDLDHAPPMDILDIGAGSGNMGMVVQSMGHRYLGTDVADPWYDELCELTGVKRIVAPVVRGEPYRPVERKFDLIMIMLPAFHRKSVAGSREYWSVEDWRRFLLDLVNGLLKPEGAIFILMPLDKNDDGTLSYSPLLEFARDRGARLDRTYDSGPIRHILWDPATEDTFAEAAPQVARKSDAVLEWPE